MAKFTKGPWQFEQDGREPYIVANDGLTRIADIYECGMVVSMKEAVANAHLMASAPDLLKIAEKIMACLASSERILNTYEENLLTQAREALYKAKGE